MGSLRPRLLLLALLSAAHARNRTVVSAQRRAARPSRSAPGAAAPPARHGPRKAPPVVASIVVVEPRPVRDALFRVVVEFAEALPRATTHWWHGPSGAAASLARWRAAGVRVVGHAAPPPPAGPLDAVRRWYNVFLASDDLWRALPPTHALVVQADTGLCGGAQAFDPRWLRYDFLGPRNAYGRYNGGLSLRSVRAQRAANARLRKTHKGPLRGGTNEDTRLWQFCDDAATACALAPRAAADRFGLEAPPADDPCPSKTPPWAYHKAFALRCKRELEALCPAARWRFPNRTSPS